MKKRCSRCHARLDGNRKTCPYCGTMVRTPRGNVKVAASVRSGGVSGMLENIRLPALTGKHLLAGLGAVLTLVLLIAAFSCDSCTACSSCGSCSSCAVCSSCGSCAACDSCGGKSDGSAVNGPNYNCEYYYGSTLYYVDGDRLVALEDGSGTGRDIAGGHGIECIYADDSFVYYIVAGKIYSAPADGYVVSSGDAPPGSVLLEPADVGLEKINGFALNGKDGLCYWGQDAAGTKVIRVTDREQPDSGRTIYTGRYSNVQCYGGGVYFVSGEDATNGYILRADMNDGSCRTILESRASYYTLSDGMLIACMPQYLEDGTPAEHTRVVYIDPETGKERSAFDNFPRIRGLAANDQWVYYVTDDAVTGQTLVYRFAEKGKNHQLVFRKDGSYRLYGVAGSYFSLYGDDVYYICNYDQAPGSIVIREHTVLDK